MANDAQSRTDTLPSHPPLALVALLAVILCVEFLLLVTCLTQHYGSDFAEFWSASRLGLSGHAADIYNGPTLFNMERTAVPTMQNGTPWFYPPTFYLAILPFGLLPYKLAYWIFEIATLGFYLGVIRSITANRTAFWCAATFPGLWMNLMYGQNGFLTAALAAAALLSLKRHPARAGVFIGLLAIKPHLALLFPVALIAVRAWRALASAALTTAAFSLVSAWVMGTAALKQSLGTMGSARGLLEDGILHDKMPTVFSFSRILGLPMRAAYCAHALVALVAIAVVWKVWRTCDDGQLRGAALMIGTLMVSPYMLVYDLTWLACPVLWIALAGTQHVWFRLDRAVLAAAWLVPLFMAELAATTHIQTGPWILGALLCVTLKRIAAVKPGNQREPQAYGVDSLALTA